MENNMVPPPDDEHARAALEGLDADSARFAEKVVTVWWYHPSLGVILAMMIFGVSYPGILGLALIPLGIIAIAILVRAYRLHTGIWISSTAGPETRRIQRLLMSLCMILMGIALALRIAEPSPWWALLPAFAGFVAICVVGRRYDQVLRREIADPGARL